MPRDDLRHLDRDPHTEARAVRQMATTLETFAARWVGHPLAGTLMAASTLVHGVADEVQQEEAQAHG
jgi:hypothetical protein